MSTYTRSCVSIGLVVFFYIGVARIATADSIVPPGWVSSYGSAIPGGAQNDDSVSQIDLGFAFPFFGQTYTTAYVSGNGFIQFGGSDGSRCCDASVPDFLSGYPTIAGAWFDLYPPGGGAVALNTSTPNTAVITWDAIPEFPGSTDPSALNTFQIELDSNGNIRLSYMSFDVGITVSHHTTLIGITPGGGVSDPGSTDLLALTYPIDPGGTIYQLLTQVSGTSIAASTGFSGQTLTFGTGAIASVPEPGTLGLFVAGVLCAFLYRRFYR